MISHFTTAARGVFRSKAHERLFLKRLAIIDELSGGPPAEHLGPMSEPLITKLERHRMDSVEHRAGRA